MCGVPRRKSCVAGSLVLVGALALWACGGDKFGSDAGATGTGGMVGAGGDSGSGDAAGAGGDASSTTGGDASSTMGSDGSTTTDSGASSTGDPARPTMYVSGTSLYDPCGEKIVLRGANTPGKVSELAKTGANAVRLVYYTDAEPAAVDADLAEARQAGMVAIPSFWDATGDWSKLQECIDAWLAPAMVEVLQRHEAHTLLNIANEAGDGSISSSDYRQTYAEAVAKLRAAGLRMPIVIDGLLWARNENSIFDNAEYLLQQDPLGNLVFDWHAWDAGQPASRYVNAFDTANAMGITMIVGEFAQQEFAWDSGAIDYGALQAAAQEREIGWLWWWWFAFGDDDAHAMTEAGDFGDWEHVGEEIAITGKYSIQNTAERTHYQVHGRCQRSP